ncbi:MAG: MotA/TolQ/ExbB proton channel family protein [Deferribacteres bacterium]|nr:MotA/TolQ/ExbB proton channel family protein [candidate division KSB1 bacterium]MCB9510625.1 MotA/TolQ/ExbB proton channel family protein [Deferribacteres bacterium]
MKNAKLNKLILTRKGGFRSMLVATGLLLMLSLGASQVLGNASGNSRAKATVSQQISAASDSAKVAEEKNLSAWDIIEMTSWLFWPFVLLTGAGIMLLSLKSLQEYQEKSRAAGLLDRRVSVRDLKAVVRQVQESQASRASKLFHAIIATFNKTNRAEPIGDDINAYLNTERESFETFHRVMGFLSDTAGALGLLGTVWGIFETFHGGKMDGPTILQGMSVSLVTTLVGLIISLVLNAGATSVFSLFNKQLNLLATRAEELRQALLFVETKQAPSKPRTVNNGSYFAGRPKPEQQEGYPYSNGGSYSPGSSGPAYDDAGSATGYSENGHSWA